VKWLCEQHRHIKGPLPRVPSLGKEALEIPKDLCDEDGPVLQKQKLKQQFRTSQEIYDQYVIAEAQAAYAPPRNEAFHALLKTMGDTHDRKNRDYADTANGRYYSNFESAAVVAGCTVDTVFRVLIGIKLARLDELLKGKTPANESLNDSLLDLSVYSALWTSYRQEHKAVRVWEARSNGYREMLNQIPGVPCAG
jgi:hypothetical protein